MSPRLLLRNALAPFLRAVPYFPGKEKVSAFLNHHLTASLSESDCLVTARMRDGGLFKFDLRSPTEWPAFWSGGYECKTLDLLRRILPRGAVVLDVGANVGLYSIPLGRKLKTLNGRVYAIEPINANFARLAENITLNSLQEVVIPVKRALSDRDGSIALQKDSAIPTQTGNAVTLGCGFDGTRIDETVQATTLDQLAQEYRITACHLVKVDIEGGEFRFLQGGRAFLEQHRPVIICELNEFWMDKFAWTLQDLDRLARSMGYEIRGCGRRHFEQVRELIRDVEDVLLLAVDSPMHQRMRRLLV